ncbi:hypothetical protein BV25DRAFT_684941 [Artomyces pyxidatus]|uniref:Uncharacterized protein n=1 Tax=Artomyces pyxidatus TaxID=48021 RepID=A0ACB8T1H5_9AGAM|nr:hypothetical protein BV25DRAFT_684941 [Artomyces pyxidatus]
MTGNIALAAFKGVAYLMICRVTMAGGDVLGCSYCNGSSNTSPEKLRNLRIPRCTSFLSMSAICQPASAVSPLHLTIFTFMIFPAHRCQALCNSPSAFLISARGQTDGAPHHPSPRSDMLSASTPAIVSGATPLRSDRGPSAPANGIWLLSLT